MFSIPRIKEMMEKYGMAPLKKLGQNFLTSEGVLRKIVASADLSAEGGSARQPAGGKKTDVVLEVGPGFGVLTAELAREAAKVIAVEKDKKMVRALKDNLAEWGIENVSIIHGDVLKMEMKSLLPAKYKVVANIPYYITSPIIRKFLEKEEIKPELIVLLVQKEVARRICAKPPRLNLLAVSVQFFGNPKIEFYVPAGAFYPKPKVDSAVIKIVPFEKPLLPKERISDFFALVKAGFASPRKQLAANLARHFKITREKVEEIFSELGFGLKIRTENLSVKDWLDLF
ncbi:MAG: 16S rRNA (adenine(1518)-N(6)/adenine(1519)-N(6))-dimethyltransferase RsmA, partial [Patescibacteria group bacterium]